MFYVCAYLINTNAVVLCHIGSVVIDIGHIDTDGDACTARVCLTHHTRCRAGCPITSHHCQGEHVNCLPVKMLCGANMHDCRPLNACTIYLLSCKGKDTWRKSKDVTWSSHDHHKTTTWTWTSSCNSISMKLWCWPHTLIYIHTQVDNILNLTMEWFHILSISTRQVQMTRSLSVATLPFIVKSLEDIKDEDLFVSSTTSVNHSSSTSWPHAHTNHSPSQSVPNLSTQVSINCTSPFMFKSGSWTCRETTSWPVTFSAYLTQVSGTSTNWGMLSLMSVKQMVICKWGNSWSMSGTTHIPYMYGLASTELSSLLQLL